MRTVHCRTFTSLPAVAALSIALGACAKPSGDAVSDSSASTSASATTMHDTGMAGMAGMSHGDSAGSGSRMASMPGMTGNADRDFLHMMSDHHKGMIALAHATVDRKDASAGVKADASKFDKKQDAELDSMTTMLEQSFKDSYTPKVMVQNQAMNDSVLAKKGTAFDRAFRETVIKHHQEGIKMMDEFLSTLTDAKLKAMTQRMRADQQREISELQQKLGKG